MPKILQTLFYLEITCQGSYEKEVTLMQNLWQKLSFQIESTAEIYHLNSKIQASRNLIQCTKCNKPFSIALANLKRHDQVIQIHQEN